MLNRKLVARELMKIADVLDCYSVNGPLLLTASFKQDCLDELKKKRPDLNAEKVSREILKLNNPKKQKMALFWICKNSLILPEDQYELDKAYEILDKTHKDFKKFDGPIDIINSQDSTIKRQVLKTSFNPDSCKFFFDKYNAGNGVKIYTVKDSLEGMLAVRRAIDASWGLDSNPWRFAARKDDLFEKEFLSLSEQKRDELDVRLLWDAWKIWKNYSAYPKRIAFKNGKLLAFCASDELKVQWWDEQEKHFKKIPSDGAKDDYAFIEKFIYGKKERMEKAEDPNTSPEELRELAGDEYVGVRYDIAIHRNTPEDVLKEFAGDKNVIVRAGTACNPNTPKGALSELAKDENKYVREIVARNPSTPVDVLRKLAEDRNTDVRQHAIKSLNSLQH